MATRSLADALSLVTTTLNGLMRATDKVKLDGIASGATANDTDANLKNRANHTGTQLLSTISDAGTLASQNAASVAITGGAITGITDLAIADGGTGASSASAARSNLGAEAALGNPASDGYLLSSTAAGVRSWIAPASGGGTSLTIQEVDGTPSGAFTTLKLPNGTLTDNGDGSATYTPTSSGSGSSVAVPFDAAPTTPHANDDEFSGSSLDAKWVAITSEAGHGVTTTIANGWLKFESSTSGTGQINKHMLGFRQNSPTGSFSVMAKIGGGANRSGIFVASTSASKVNILSTLRASGVSHMADHIGATYSESGDWSDWDGTNNYVNFSHYAPTYLRIRWDATTSTLYFDASGDGVAWFNFANRTGQSQPNRIGLCIYGAVVADIKADNVLGCDWFRVTEP